MSEHPEPTYANDPAQLALPLAPGNRDRGEAKLVWRAWSPDEQFAIDMDDTIGSYSRGRFVEVTR